MNKILKYISDEIEDRSSRGFVAAYNMKVEKAKSQKQGEIIGLELAMQIIQSEPMLCVSSTEVDTVINLRADGKFVTFKDGYKITVERS